jgi:ABC-type phosphate transport system substrate-binding protein
MTSSLARRIVPVCFLSAVAIAAAVAPGSANAALLTKCAGSSIEAAGSSLQAVAQQQVWAVDFNKSKAAGACSGKQGSKGTPTVTYKSTSSGKGFAAWNEKLEYGALGYIGTDNTVNQAEKEELEAEADSEGTKSTVLTIPVVQAAVAVVVNLPEGCTGNSTVASNRLALSQKVLEGIFSGSVKTWNQITEAGDQLVQVAGGPTCDKEAAITPVVRKDASGTTHIFKRFLNWTDSSALKTKSGEKTWNELSELANSTLWPETITPAEGEKGSGLLKKVAETPSSIGYAVLAEARELGFAPSTGGPSTQKFWVELEDSSKKGKAKYADPSDNGDAKELSNSNCKKTVYTNGKASFPPPSVKSTWNEVTTEQFSKTYALCGLTYDLALTNAATYKGHGTTQGQATTVQNYLQYVVEKKGGQKEIANHDYLALPSNVMARAQEGPSQITWEE